MADVKITALTAISANPVNPATFPIPMVDLLDNTITASGTTKKVTVNQILGAGGTATLASATITGDLTVDTNVLKVDSTLDKVGVGVATLTGLQKFNVAGDIGITSDLVLKNGSGTAQGYIFGSSGLNYRVIASNPHVWQEGGTDLMRLNSDGLGVGLTPVALAGFGSTFRQKGVGAAGGIFTENSTTASWFGIYSGTSAADCAALIYPSGGTLRFATTTSVGTAGFATQMTLDASGRLLIGTATSGTSAGDGIAKLGTYGHCISQTGASIASGSFSDLTVVTSGAGYQGFLSVANTQDSNALVRTQTTFSVFGRGTSSTITQIATANGSTGPASFTVTTPSNGVIRITNTSGAAATISTQFFGGSSA